MSFVICGYITPEEVRRNPLTHHNMGRSYTASGYGSKLPTMNMARIGKKWYRIYCACYSNSGTCYIIKDRKHYVVRDCDMPEVQS